MKTIVIGALLAALAAVPAMAQPEASAPKPNNVCLWTYLIDHTTIKDKGKAIVFHMRNGKDWINTLKAPCPALQFNGFAYVTRNGQICSNMETIMVLRTHQVCMLGNFEPYTPAPRKKPGDQH